MPDRTLSVALIGTGFMAKAHSNAWRQAPHFFPLAADIRMATICGRDPARSKKAAEQFGWASSATDWEEVVADPLIDVVDICTPNDSHAPIAIAAARAGKAILSEKPLARNVNEARQMTQAVKRARVVNMVTHNYRRVPAIALAKEMIDAGEIGDRIFHFRARYAQDWIAGEDFPIVWRLRSRVAGSGALGDIGAHIVDLARYLVGEIESVSAVSQTFVSRRPERARQNGRKRMVDVDDAVSVVGKFRHGSLLNLEATRFAHGRKNQLAFEINGSAGSIGFDLERMNELRFFNQRDPAARQGFGDLLVTESSHPYVGKWWPPGHIIGYEHSFVHTIADFVNAVATNKSVEPSFLEGLKNQQVLDAIARSARRGGLIRL
jgi:Predicted dehydrogenases and related proteins